MVEFTVAAAQCVNSSLHKRQDHKVVPQPNTDITSTDAPLVISIASKVA